MVPHWKRGHFSIIYDGRRAAAAARSAAAAAGGGNGDSGGGGRGLSTAAVPSAPPPSAAPPPPPPPLPQQQGQQEEEQPQEQQRSTQLWFLDHVKGTYIDVSSYTKELKGEAAEVVAEGVDELLADGVVEAVKVKSAGGVKFKPVKVWIMLSLLMCIYSASI